jgi:uncharacterized membrane protein YphA (DoxX/SURF4 family)
MKNPLRSERSFDLGLLLARLPMGAFFLIAGVEKVHGGVEKFVQSFITDVPHAIPRAWGEGYLRAFPWLEIAVGILLILGLFTRLGGFIGALMVISITIGFTGVITKGLPFHPNMIYLGLLLALLLVGPGRMSLDAMMFKRPRAAVA